MVTIWTCALEEALKRSLWINGVSFVTGQQVNPHLSVYKHMYNTVEHS